LKAVRVSFAWLIESFNAENKILQTGSITIKKNIDKVKEELADVLSYAFLLADKYNFDVKEIVLDKIKLNSKKYPIDKSKGTAKKYNEL